MNEESESIAVQLLRRIVNDVAWVTLDGDELVIDGALKVTEVERAFIHGLWS